MTAARVWFVRNRLVLVTGLVASLPMLVPAIDDLRAGWMPLYDSANTAIRSYDVLSTHPPLLGPHSTASGLIGESVQSPGPLLYWLLALPVRLGALGPSIAVAVVNVCCVVGALALARRRGGLALMFATGGAFAAMCMSLPSHVWHDLWGPAVVLAPFTLLVFLAWSIACGEFRLLPLTALVASFVVQSHLAYVLPGVAMAVVALALLAPARRRVPRGWIVATVAVVALCWSLPLAEEVVHRPGNVERVAEAATVDTQTFGARAGLRGTARAIGVPPRWLRGSRTEFDRLAELAQDPAPGTSAAAVLLVAWLCGLVAAGLRSGRRDVAAAATLALALIASLFAIIARAPSSSPLFVTISYTTWWASPAGMFAWLAAGYGTLALGARNGRFAAARARLARVARPATAAAVAGVAAVGALVAAGQDAYRLQNVFEPARSLADRTRAGAPEGTVLITGDENEVSGNLQSAIAYAMRTEGRPFVMTSLLGLGSRYDPRRHPPDAILTVTEHPRRGARVLAREVLVDVPAEAAPSRRVFYVVLSPGG